MTYILHIDTSADTGKIALGGDGKLLAIRTSNENRNFASLLNGMIDEVLAEAGIKIGDLAAVSHCGGPGSYTGLRIGLSTAKAICYTLDKPLIQHDKLLLLTLKPYYNYLLRYESYVTILPARDKEFFISIHNNKLENVLKPQHIFLSQLSDLMDEYGKNSFITGQMNDEAEALISETAVFTLETDIDVHHWVSYSFLAFQAHKFENLATTEPVYLKQVYTHK
jgi:tRNA threonylcarbamoyladenosine biosynthesis protein TsaB